MRTGVAVLMSASMALGLEGVASATVYDYNIYGQTGKGGAGRSYGEIEFKLDRNRFTWIGSIRDICPADGYGMELRIRVRKTNGTVAMRNNVIQDLNGCGPREEYTTYPVPYTVNAPIKEVRAELWATQDGAPQFRIAASTWKDNPYT